jgi:phosphoribosyl 1,2-cyclic phosphate phosphodiesterase
VLGSAAAEGWPAAFCVCEACGEARRRGGKDLRRRTTYQLGDTVRVDWGPDSYASMIALGLDYAPLQHLFITHSHQEHFFILAMKLHQIPDQWMVRGLELQ